MARQVLALLRVSTGAQARADRGGLDRQRIECERLARAHGLAIAETVLLDGVSGVEVQRDPRFAALLARLTDPNVHGVVVADWDRLFRRGRWADFGVLDAFADTASVIYCSAGRIDPSEESGEWVAGVSTIMSGAERRRLLARTRGGKEKRRREGRRAEGDGVRWMPLGVRFDFASGAWSYVEPEASRVRTAYAAFLGGVTSLRAVARASGLDHGRAAGGLSSLMLSVLRQPLYRGAYRVDRRWVKGRAMPRAPEEVYEVQVLEHPLVSPADWQRVQVLLASRRERHAPRREVGDDTTYHGHLDCAACGSVLWIERQQPGRGWPSYVCGGGRRAGTCRARSISSRLADPVIDGALAAALGSVDALAALLAPAIEGAGERERRAAREAGRRLAELDNRRRRVQEGYEAGLYRGSEAAKRLADIDGETAVLREVLESRRSDDLPPAEVVARVVEVFADWRDLARAEKRSLLRELGVRVRLAVPAARRPEVAGVEVVALGITR